MATLEFEIITRISLFKEYCISGTTTPKDQSLDNRYLAFMSLWTAILPPFNYLLYDLRASVNQNRSCIEW
jgi:hypothetical protein